MWFVTDKAGFNFSEKGAAGESLMLSSRAGAGGCLTLSKGSTGFSGAAQLGMPLARLCLAGRGFICRLVVSTHREDVGKQINEQDVKN